MFLNTQQAAQELGISAADLEELIRDGLIPAYRKDEEWLIEESAIRRLRAQFGGTDPREMLHRIQRSEAAKEQPVFRFSRFVIDVLHSFSLITLLLSVTLTAISLINRSSTGAIIGAAVAVLSIAYIVLYDLMQAVFSINATLQRLALDVAEIKVRRKG